MTDLWHNPLGTDGFEFVEFTSPDPASAPERCSSSLAFAWPAVHRSKDVLHYKQGDINLILNGESAGQPAAFKRRYGPSANAMGLQGQGRGRRLRAAAIAQGAEPVEPPVGPYGAQDPGDPWGRRRHDLPSRPLRQPDDLRRGLQAGRGQTGDCRSGVGLSRGSTT